MSKQRQICLPLRQQVLGARHGVLVLEAETVAGEGVADLFGGDVFERRLAIASLQEFQDL